jgi:hypothetical protein
MRFTLAGHYGRGYYESSEISQILADGCGGGRSRIFAENRGRFA